MLELEQLSNYNAELHQSCDFAPRLATPGSPKIKGEQKTPHPQPPNCFKRKNGNVLVRPKHDLANMRDR